LITLLTIISFGLWVYSWIVIVAALISWVQPNPYNPIVRFLWGVTEPVYQFIRRYIPTQIGGFDFAPILVLIVINLFQLLINDIISNLLMAEF
jgi:YggT family protein